MSSQDIPYQVRYSRRKTIGIYISRESGVEVRAPHHASPHEIQRFVQLKGAWIQKHLNNYQSQPERYQPDYRWGAIFYCLGQPVVFQPTVSQVDEGDVVMVLGGNLNESESQVERRINHWFRQKAQEVFTQRHAHWVELMSESFRLPTSFVELRSMRRRWGSCRKSGKIVLNTHLIKYPQTCIDVVLVHELCHLLEFNHSKRFYQLMDKALPQWRQLDAQLNDLSLLY